MTILASPTYTPDGQFNFPRSYTNFFAFSWVSGYTVHTAGNPWVFETTGFGGVRVHLKFKDAWWTWSSNIYSLDFLLEDYWAELAPLYLPQSAGAINLQWGYNGETLVPGFAVNQPLTQEARYFPLPPAPPEYWLQLPP